MSNEQELTSTTNDVAVLEDSAVDELVAEESFVEEVSIDGMCGVY